MTLTELSGYDGKDGRRAYLAVNGTVYDVTDSRRWIGGQHPPDHQAGQDLTEELARAPHVRSVIERFPVVGTIEEEITEEAPHGYGKLIVSIIIAVVIAALAFILLR